MTCARRSLLTCLVSLSLPAIAAGQPAQAPASPPAPISDRAAIDRAIAAVYPSLVRIFVVTLDQAGGRELKREVAGSGTIISADGYVVTNHHVAGRARRIMCTLSTKEEVPADLVGTDPLVDIAVIKLHPAKPRVFPVARFGGSTTLRSGDTVLAMGSPLALSQSVTKGIVSNTQMIMPQFGPAGLGLLDGEDVGSIVRWIGHDASIYPGNSGGPLVNLLGQIVGVNEISYGLAGAIPGDLAKSVVDAIIRDGRVHRSWTGIEVQARVGQDTLPGALIAWVAEKSPAEAAGARAGDVLVKVNDTAVDVKFAEQLPPVNQVLFGLPIGKPSRLLVRREGKDVALSIVPIERPVASSIASELRPWGLAVANLSGSEAREMGRESTDGVRVVSLRPGGPSQQAKPPLERDDVIVEVEGQPVRDVAELEARTKALAGPDGKRRSSVLVAIDRGRERRLTVVEIGNPVTNDPPMDASKAWVPVNVQVLTPPLAEHLGIKGRTGVRVTRVIDGKTPLKVGDVILAIDGDPVRASAPADEDLFASAIRRARIGSTANLSVFRNGAEISVPVILAATPRQAREMKPYVDSDFEFKVRNVVETDRNDPKLATLPVGVIVESVSEGGWAALAHLLGGDVILNVQGHAISNVDELQAQMDEIRAKHPASVVFGIRRGIRTTFIEIQPTWK
jgi:serine protease Do